MSMRRLPQAVFNLELLPDRRAYKDLTRMFEQHLSKHLGDVSVFGPWLFLGSTLKVELATGDVFVGIARRTRRGPNYRAWWIDISSSFGGALDTSSEDETKYAKELRLVSDVIHAMLVDNPGVTQLRWFFKGWDNKTPGVPTPADLPWHALEIPGVRDAANR